MKFKKQEKVKVINNDNIRSIKEGEIVTIKIVDPLPEMLLKYYIENKAGKGCWCMESEIEKIVDYYEDYDRDEDGNLLSACCAEILDEDNMICPCCHEHC